MRLLAEILLLLLVVLSLLIIHKQRITLKEAHKPLLIQNLE